MDVIFRANIKGYIAGIQHVSDVKVFLTYPTDQELKEYHDEFRDTCYLPSSFHKREQYDFEIIIDKVFITKK